MLINKFVPRWLKFQNILLGIGVLVAGYAVLVLLHVQQISDIGLKSAFTTSIRGVPRGSISFENNPLPKQGDKVLAVGDIPIKTWPDLLHAPTRIKDVVEKQFESNPKSLPKWASRKITESGKEQLFVLVTFSRMDGEKEIVFKAWCPLGKLPINEMVPAILWFFLKAVLFVVGVLVFWKRPNDPAATQFFVLCIVTLGAYIAGYHWAYILTELKLIVGFIIFGVLLPAVTLHFYLVFPRPKQFLIKHRGWTLAGIYGLPLAFMVILFFCYFRLRGFYQDRMTATSLEMVEPALRLLLWAIYTYLCVAAIWYVASVTALLHSFFTVNDATEKNQVKCILVGAVAALIPIGYSLFLAIFYPDNFGAGGATWPMFAASVFLTAAFTVSITRYRLMELDKIISSGANYFFISFLAGIAYYGILFLGTLIFNQVFASPPLSEAIRASTIVLVLLLVLDVARNRLRKALDRRFNREKYHLDRTLQRMGEAVQQLVDPPTLVQRLLHASTDLLGVNRGAVYLRTGKPLHFRIAGWVGPAPATVEVANGSPLVEELSKGETVTLSQRNGFRLTPAQLKVRELQGEIAQGLSKEGELLAFLVLGPKGTGNYRQEDLNLLAAFTQITVMALGNAEGHETIETLNSELQAKIEKIAEQQRRIFALQSQLRRQGSTRSTRSEPKKESQAVAENGNGSKTEAENEYSEIASSDNNEGIFQSIVGNGEKVRDLLQMVRKVARTDAVVLIRGESGTGKNLLAQAIHETSSRAEKPFVKVHCAALAPTLLETELFGHVKGAFTGAHRDKVGRFEMAEGGTLFLDEIGDISPEVQTKLLKVLQERTIERVGSSEPMKVDVRIVAATHQNLEELIQQGRFREDLYYRINVFPVLVPSLKDRREDIPELALHFLQIASERCGKRVIDIDDDAMGILKSYHWPGNIRQLENVIERAVVLVEGLAITAEDIPEDIKTIRFSSRESIQRESPAAMPMITTMVPRGNGPRVKRNKEQEKEKILQALHQAGGNKAQAARDLGMARSTLVSKLKKMGLL